MNFTRKFFAVLIDSSLMILLTLFIILIVSNSLGDYSIRLFTDDRNASNDVLPSLIIFSSVIALYLFSSGLNKWQTIGILFVTPNNRYFIKSVLALFIDFAFILLLTSALSFIINRFLYIQYFYLFTIIIFVFCLISGLLRGRSIGKLFFGIDIKGQIYNLSVIQSLKREVLYKFCIVFLCPWLLFYIFGITNPFNTFIDVFVFGLILMILFYVYKGELWWNKLSNTKKEFRSLSKPRKTIYYIVTVSIFLGLLMFIKYENNKSQDSSLKIWGFNLPLNFPEYPNIPKVNKHAEFMANQNTSPKDYILGLFDKYDIVVLGENYHGEYTQWELITDIVKDKRFTEKVRNVFTEYGSARHQDKVDKFLTTKYESDLELEKATASVMEYMSGGFYYFLKNLNKLNNQLPDSLKVKEYFTDILDWDYLAFNRFYESKITSANRDSLMAQVTIDWYRSHLKQGIHKKCLIITNYRHAFGYSGGIDRIKKYSSGNQAQYIYEEFPNQTACVMQNAPLDKLRTLFLPIAMPINHGIWDKAYQLNNYKPVGFDLQDSPFGLDSFDMYPLFGAKPKIFYQDIFTGVIFNNRFEELYVVGYPFKQYAVETEYLQKHPEADTNSIKNITSQGRWAGVKNEAEKYQIKSIIKALAWANILSLMLVVISGYTSLIFLSIDFLKHIFKHSNEIA